MMPSLAQDPECVLSYAEQRLEPTVQQCSTRNTRQSSMPICISCSTPVKNLYTTYSKADDRSLGKGVRLTQCPRCKRFADKYVEHDFIVLFIDLVLIKPQVREDSMSEAGTCHSLRLHLGLQTSPVQPARPRRRLTRPLHPPPGHSSGPVRCLLNVGSSREDSCKSP